MEGLFKWFGAGLNRRHMDFQSIALPTELPNQLLKLREGKAENYFYHFFLGFSIRNIFTKKNHRYFLNHKFVL